MGTVDDNGIGIRNIDAVLNNCRRQQHIVVVVREVEHNLLQLLRLHLSVSDGDTGIRDVFMNHLGDMRQIADTVVDEIDLSIARHLEIDGICDDLRAKGMYLRLNGIAIGRRCLDDTQVTGTDE